jgi:cytochrome c biogenesis protein CcmG/thiol:disulfide interchange protein DsbE
MTSDPGRAAPPRSRAATRSRLLVAILASLLIVVGCGSDGSQGGSIGSSAPAIAGTTLEGTTFDLADLRGRPVVVNFWASWCTPCRNEFPVLAEALDAHEADGMALVGVLFKDDPAPAQAFVTEFGATWPTVDDPDDAFAEAYRVVAPPQTYFIDAAGIVQGIHIGELLPEDFDQQWAKIAP